MKVKSKKDRSHAFTLVELLVVITILVLLAAIAIPQLRMVTKERNIRETARVVASLFAQASQRAQADGVAGVLLRRNPNFVALGGYGYAVTSLSLLRKVPDYTGDNSTKDDTTRFGAGATNTGVPFVVRIPKPIDQDDVQVIQTQDLISLNNSAAQYRIEEMEEVSPDGVPFLDLTLNDAGYLPDPSDSLPDYAFAGVEFDSGVPFVVQRTPRILKSSTLTLPTGYIVDLRFSGFNMEDSSFEGKSGIDEPDVSRTESFPTTVLEPFPRKVESVGGSDFVVNFSDADVGILFDQTGGVDRVFMRKSFDGNRVSTYTKLALESLYLFVAEQEEDQTLNPLSLDTNLWVSVSNATGVTNVGYNIASSVSLEDLATMYNGPGNVASATERASFNAEIVNSRNLTNLGTAAQ